MRVPLLLVSERTDTLCTPINCTVLNPGVLRSVFFGLHPRKPRGRIVIKVKLGSVQALSAFESLRFSCNRRIPAANTAEEHLSRNDLVLHSWAAHFKTKLVFATIGAAIALLITKISVEDGDLMQSTVELNTDIVARAGIIDSDSVQVD